MRIPFLELKPTYLELKDEFDAAWHRVMDSGWYLLGSELESFEKEYAAYCGAKHCVGVGSGLDALHLALRAWEIGPGDEVIVPSNTFIATWLAVTFAGAAPVPVEPDSKTFNLDPGRVAAAITSRTRAIIPVPPLRPASGYGSDYRDRRAARAEDFGGCRTGAGRAL